MLERQKHGGQRTRASSDSPLRPGPVLEVHVRPRAGACSDAPAAEGGAAGMTRAAACGAGVARISAAGGVKLVAAMPRVDCPKCGVVVASVPWAEPGSRFTRDFEAECAWLMTVAEPEDGERFPARGVEDRRVTSPIGSRIVSGPTMPSPFDGLTAIGVDETQLQEGPHVHHRGRRPRTAPRHLGARRVRQGRVRPVLPDS